MRLQYRHLILLMVIVLGIISKAEGQVQPSPWVRSQYFDNNGRPLAGGCVFTYISGTLIPLATYSDAAGTKLNSNPVSLDSAGRANIFLTAAAYTLKLYTAGGLNCASGVQLWSIDGINPSANSILAGNNVFSGNNTFQATTTFNGPATFNVGFTSNGPSNLTLGGALGGTFTGSPTFAGTPNFSGGFAATTGTFSGQIISTLATGTPPFVIASTTQVPNLNVSQLEGCTWEIPCPLGSTTPNTIVGTTIKANTSFAIGAGTPQTGIQGTDTNLLSSGTVSGTGNTLCLDANGGATTSCPTSAKTQGILITSGICTTPNGGELSCTMGPFNWAVAFVDSGYALTCTAIAPSGTGGHPSVTIYWTSKSASGFGLQMNAGSASAAGANSVTEIDCSGIHP